MVAVCAPLGADASVSPVNREFAVVSAQGQSISLSHDRANDLLVWSNKAEALVERVERLFQSRLSDLRTDLAQLEVDRTGLRIFTFASAERPWRIVTPSDELPEHIVLLVHGLDEPGTIWDDLAPALADAGHAVVRFDYPNDQPIADSADELTIAIQTMRAQGVNQLSIVAHSMGGLVSRDALTRPDFSQQATNTPTINRLILVGTPNSGSLLAPMRAIAEIREQLVRWRRAPDHDPLELLGFIADGAGESGPELAVGSDYLKQLNARPAIAGVKITCIVGEMAPSASNLVAGFLKTSLARRVLGDRAPQLSHDLNIVSSELGDGVVPVASATLLGASDVVHVHANHRTMLVTLAAERLLTPLTGAPPADPPAIRVILDRLNDP